MAGFEPAFVSVKSFAEAHDLEPEAVRKYLDRGDLPEIEKENEKGKRYVNMELVRQWAREGKIYLSDLSRKK
ncbi:hypothetical protein M2H12_15000 [Vibrio vulnificus]|nr:hypothetical protein [Vibrio vulnificus]MCU8167008.1 hypothetical protein [Vibrio vulnificus]MCU8171447.1 hypothetical protein [Vibrio vulnificus]MCU8266219.1 hypothetical protein [Vibrio vulnificus]